MRIAAAITTYGRLVSLQRCIACVRAQTRPVDEIIVLDDHSPDDTVAWLALQPDVRLLTPERKGGPAQSCRTVLEEAFERGHDLLWIMDDDVYSMPDALEKLLACTERLEASDVRVGAVKALELQWERRGPMYPPFGLPQTVAQALRHRYMCPLDSPVVLGSPEPVPIAMLTLAGTLIPREALASIGFPDPGYFYYGEDCDFGFRLLEAGFGVYLAPDAVVAHKGAGWRSPRYLDSVANWRYYYMYRNQWVIASRYRGLIGCTRSLACRIRILGGCLYRMISEVGRGNPGAARMAASGILDAILGRMGKVAPLPGDPAPVR